MLLMLDNYDSFTANLYAYFAEIGCAITVVKNDRIDLNRLSDQLATRVHPCVDIEGIVISPGPKSPDDCGKCRDVVALATGCVPILGVCLGHQVIAREFGAQVHRGTRPMHGRVTPLENDGTGLFSRLPRRFEVTRYHSLVVSDTQFPKSLVVNARSDDGTIMALSHKSLPIFGVQFHPEALLTQYGHPLLRNFVRTCIAWRNGSWHPQSTFSIAERGNALAKEER